MRIAIDEYRETRERVKSNYPANSATVRREIPTLWLPAKSAVKIISFETMSPGSGSSMIWKPSISSKLQENRYVLAVNLPCTLEPQGDSTRI